jgi:hypothetical protein
MMFDGSVILCIQPFYRLKEAAHDEEWSDFRKTVFNGRPQFRKSGDDYSPHGSWGAVFSHFVRYISTIEPCDTFNNGEFTFACSLKVPTWAHFDDNVEEKGAIFFIELFDTNGVEITTGINDLSWSDYLDAWYTYVATDTQWMFYDTTFNIPSTIPVESVFVYLGLWEYSNGQRVYVDCAQLVKGDTPWTSMQLKKANWNTLIPNGSFEDSGGWCRLWDLVPIGEDTTAYLDALNQTVCQLHTINNGEFVDSRYKIIIAIPWAHESIDNFENWSAALDFVYDFVDDCIESWNLSSYHDRLKLTGFYMLNEEGEEGNDQAAFYDSIGDYIRNNGYRFYGSPYHSMWHRSSFNKQNGQHFDCLWQQPNAWPPVYKDNAGDTYWENVGIACREKYLTEDSAWVYTYGIPLHELFAAESIAYDRNACSTKNMGINIEWVPGQEDGGYYGNYGRVLDYLSPPEECSENYNFSPASHLFYDAAGFGYYCSHHSANLYREQYDSVYNYLRNVPAKIVTAYSIDNSPNKIYLSDDIWTIRQRRTYNPPNSYYDITAMACGDFDGDGDEELVTAYKSCDDARIYYSEDGLYPAEWRVWTGPAPSYKVTAMAAGNLDTNDPGDELMIAIQNGDTANIYMCQDPSDSTEMPGYKVYRNIGYWEVTAMACGDFDGDGDEELVTAFKASDEAAIYWSEDGSNPGGWRLWQGLGQNFKVTAMAAGNLDTDTLALMTALQDSNNEANIYKSNDPYSNVLEQWVYRPNDYYTVTAMACGPFNDDDELLTAFKSVNDARIYCSEDGEKPGGGALCWRVDSLNASYTVAALAIGYLRNAGGSICGDGSQIGDESPTNFLSFEVYPSICNRRLNITLQGIEQFSEDYTKNIKLMIYDITGRLIKTFNELSSTVIWDRKDNHQRAIPTGVYFIRLTTPIKDETQKVIMLK